MSNNTIVCHQDIINIIKYDNSVTSDMLAAKMPMFTRLQDILLDMVKDYVDSENKSNHAINFKLNQLLIKYEKCYENDGSSFYPGAMKAIEDIKKVLGLIDDK